MKCGLAILLLFFSYQTFSQYHFKPSAEVAERLAAKRESLISKTHVFSENEKMVIERCNTAKKSFYHTNVEKEFILLMNLARVNKKILYSYITHTYDSIYITKLPEIPDNEKRLILKSSYGLHLSAKVHAKKSGRLGTVGHQNLDRRIRMFNFYFKRNATYGENCSYKESDHPLLHFLQLMNSKGHFANIMSTAYNSAGVSIEEHVKCGTNGVTCFGFK